MRAHAPRISPRSFSPRTVNGGRYPELTKDSKRAGLRSSASPSSEAQWDSEFLDAEPLSRGPGRSCPSVACGGAAGPSRRSAATCRRAARTCTAIDAVAASRRSMPPESRACATLSLSPIVAETSVQMSLLSRISRAKVWLTHRKQPCPAAAGLTLAPLATVGHRGDRAVGTNRDRRSYLYPRAEKHRGKSTQDARHLVP
jgi:hypothetical protein